MTEHAGLKELTGGSAGRANPYSSFTPSQMHREFDQPTTLLNELFMDPQLVGNQAGIAGAQPYVAGKLGLTPQDIARHGQLKQQLIDAPGPKLETPPINTPIRAVYDEFAPLEKQMEQARVIAEHAATLDPQRAAKQLPYFGNAWDYDLQNYIKGQARATSNADQVINTIGEAAGAAGPYTIPIKDALNKIFPNATLELEGQLRSRFPQLGEFVPVDVVNELTRSIKGFQVPDALEKPISYIDKFTNLFKPWNTAPFPGYNIRNITTNWLKQFGLDISPVQLARNESLAGKITKGEFADLGLAGKTTNLGDGAKITIGGNPRFAHLGSTDEEIARKLADQSHIYGGAGGMTQTTDTLLPQSTRSIREAVPGETPWPGLGTTIKEGIPRNLEQANPFNVRGVNRESDVNSIIRAGRNVEQHYDAKSRLAGYISLIEQGYTPEAAGKYLQTAFPNYSGQSDFERNVMRRLVPFYSYARGSIPHELRQLAQKPGIQRVMAHEANALRQGDENFVPEYLGGGLAIPMGSEKEGTQRYLTGLGTPIEQALDWLHTGAKGPQASGLSLLAQMNPLIKGPLEMLTGKSFFTNRDAGDLYSTIQNTLGLDQKPTMLEQAVANSPASRIENTSRTLMDPRKSWLDAILNLGTGAKISDVDLEKQRDIAFREKAKAELEGDKGIGKFERLYLRSGAMPTPEQEAILRGQASVDKRMRKRAEEARKQRIAIMP